MSKEVINVQMEREFYDEVMANMQSGGGDSDAPDGYETFEVTEGDFYVKL